MTYSSIIFDLDGTLLDTLKGLATTCNDVLLAYGFPTHPIDAYRNFVGDGLQILISRIVPEDSPNTVVLKCCKTFNERYQEKWQSSCLPYDGIMSMLVALKNGGCDLAVLSNKPHAFTVQFVDEMFPHDIFSVVYGQREGFLIKPDPSGALEIASLLGSMPAETLFVGDTAVDIQTGKAAGMSTAGVAWGFRSVRELTENNADIIVHHPLELVEYVLPVT